MSERFLELPPNVLPTAGLFSKLEGFHQGKYDRWFWNGLAKLDGALTVIQINSVPSVDKPVSQESYIGVYTSNRHDLMCIVENRSHNILDYQLLETEISSPTVLGSLECWTSPKSYNSPSCPFVSLLLLRRDGKYVYPKRYDHNPVNLPLVTVDDISFPRSQYYKGIGNLQQGVDRLLEIKNAIIHALPLPEMKDFS